MRLARHQKCLQRLHRQMHRGDIDDGRRQYAGSRTGPEQKPEPEQPPARSSANLRKYGTPALVVLLAVVILATITWNWNSWEGGRIEQVTDDAYVRGDITPLSTKVAGIVKEVMVSDYQSVHKGDSSFSLMMTISTLKWPKRAPQWKPQRQPSKTIDGNETWKTRRLSVPRGS